MSVTLREVRFLAVCCFVIVCSPLAVAQDEDGGWLDSGQQGDIVYLVDAKEPHIDRYDMAAESWLEPMSLPAVATAFTIDDNGMVIATGRTVYTALPYATTFDFMTNTTSDVLSIASDGVSLHLSLSAFPDTYLRLDRLTGAEQARREYFDYMTGTVFTTRHDLLVGRSVDVSPSDILRVDVNEPNEYVGQRGSPYHGAYPRATTLTLFPDQNRVIDDAGIIYSLPDLTWAGSAAGAVSAASFHGNELYVLSGRKIRRLSDNDYLETGTLDIGRDAQALFSHRHLLFAFSHGEAEPTATRVRRASVNQDPLPALDLSELSFQSDAIIVSGDGALWVMTKEHQALIRYSADDGEFNDSIRLRGTPTALGKRPDSNLVFIGYETGAITQLDLLTRIETPVSNLTTRIRSLVPFDDLLFAADSAGAWGSFYTFSLDGNLIAAEEWRMPPRAAVWNGALREMLTTSDSRLEAQSITIDGQFSGRQRDSDFTAGFHPLLVPSADGTRVLTSEGSIVDTASLKINEALANPVFAAVWPEESLIVSLRKGDGEAYWHDPFIVAERRLDVQVWGERREPLKKLSLTAVDATLATVGPDVYLVIDRMNGHPQVIDIDPTGADTDRDGHADADDAYALDPARHVAEPEVEEAPEPTDTFDPDRTDTDLTDPDTDGIVIVAPAGQQSVAEGSPVDETPILAPALAGRPEEAAPPAEEAIGETGQSAGEAIKEATGSGSLPSLLMLILLAVGRTRAAAVIARSY